ncbi:PREDICTED: disease resistance protein RGA2-like [Populus euphratica]|uniref:Disease resistance protein RGA2-like n=1 Tax=Populus euphratica TaxID=75702 RepID=A0AAJ6TRX3_POPEU|nr:PREDICTED: disease resistance protein RGA2-like [Populus euphratica]
MAEEIWKRVGSRAARAAQRINIAWGFKGELEKLKLKYSTIQAVLQDAEKRQVTDADSRVWLDKLRDIAYQAEDVLDELDYEIIQRKLETQNSMKGKVCSFFSLSNPMAICLRLAAELQKINESLDELQETATSYGLRVLSADTTPQLTDSFLCSSEDVKGRGDDVSKIINLLISSCSQQVLSVIPIVGMAGLGKTTVAKMVHREVIDRKLFDVTFWICVSDSFDDKRILREMLLTLDENTSGITEMDAIMTHLREELETKTFLLVLDDVWNEEHGEWEILRDCLLKISGNNRNVVVVNTRSRLTASIMESQSTACSHELKQLSNNEYWSIISEIVSRNGESIPSELEAIGIDIAKKCGGVPLAARFFGTILLYEKDKDKWSSIRDSDAVEMSRHYDRIEKEKLIQLWMAEGLLESSVRGEMEDIGDRKNLKIQRLPITDKASQQNGIFVGQDKGHKIEELGCLKELRGKLRIVNLEHVRDKEEAKGANLSGKGNMNTLVLVWSSERESSSSSINYKDVLEGLQPHPDTRSLEIENYQGDEFPQWIMMPTLNNLVVLKLKGCKKLPPAVHLSHLEILEIEGMDGVKIIGQEFYSSGGSGTNPIFPILKRLSVMGMRSLVEWMIPAAIAGGVQVVFPCLEELYIERCPKLESIPSMSHLSSKLVRLTIRDCNALSHITGEFHASATSLKYLTIMRCSNLASIPSLQSCIALEALSISTCYNLVSSIILESCSLVSVFIGWCGKASVRISWPLSYANMKELNIEICGKFFFDDLHGGKISAGVEI